MHCFLWEEQSFRYAGASADAPVYYFHREGFCSNRSVMLPEDKAAFVRDAKAEGHTVVMIGDGKIGRAHV